MSSSTLVPRLKIAIVSFEFPPAVAIGGIGTYAWHASQMLASQGCQVEVFAAGDVGEEPAADFGVTVHRVKAANRREFAAATVPKFLERHNDGPFDLLESPEIGAEGSEICRALPALPRVVKLHTPTYLTGEFGYETPTLAERLRFSLGACRRGRWATLERPVYHRDTDLEYHFTRVADEVSAPSRAIAERLANDWNLDNGRISHCPLPFRPERTFLELAVPQRARVVGFLGRLEARKGVVELTMAIPAILRQAPDIRFRFIGPSWPYKQSEMRPWIERQVSRYRPCLDFVGPVPRERVPDELERCDVIVLPSRWESFGFTCVEAMASGRAVIGSAAGGMAELIEPGKSGLLVAPYDPSEIAEAVMQLVASPPLVSRLGAAGRERILTHLSPGRLFPLQLAGYRRAIARARERCGTKRQVPSYSCHPEFGS